VVDADAEALRAQVAKEAELARTQRAMQITLPRRASEILGPEMRAPKSSSIMLPAQKGSHHHAASPASRLIRLVRPAQSFHASPPAALAPFDVFAKPFRYALLWRVGPL
jgi:hypothetical protein